MDHLDAATLEEFQAFNKKFLFLTTLFLVVAGRCSNVTKLKNGLKNTLVQS
jgi:hypothetical protein